jgi:hypothetical protein
MGCRPDPSLISAQGSSPRGTPGEVQHRTHVNLGDPARRYGSAMTLPPDQQFSHLDAQPSPVPVAPVAPAHGLSAIADGQPQEYQSPPSTPGVDHQLMYPSQPYPVYQGPVRPRSGLYLAAAIINWVALGIIVICTLGFGIIAAAWMVPMTIRIHKGATDGYKHTALAVCTLLFCSTPSGILMLVDDANRQPQPLQ